MPSAATAADTEEDIPDMRADKVMTLRAFDLLGSKRDDAYEAALAALHEDRQACWAAMLARDPDKMEEGKEPATADVEACAASSKARFWRGSTTGRTSWPTAP